MMVSVSALWIRRNGDRIQVLAELSGGWRVVMTVPVEGPYCCTVDVDGILAAPEDTEVRPDP